MIESDELQIMKARLRVQHTALNIPYQNAIESAKERLRDAGIDITDADRKARIINLIVDLAIFSQKTGEKEKVPLHIQYEINGILTAQVKGV